MLRLSKQFRLVEAATPIKRALSPTLHILNSCRHFSVKVICREIVKQRDRYLIACRPPNKLGKNSITLS